VAWDCTGEILASVEAFDKEHYVAREKEEKVFPPHLSLALRRILSRPILIGLLHAAGLRCAYLSLSLDAFAGLFGRNNCFHCGPNSIDKQLFAAG
jgi:hypothetical protein